MSKMSELYTEIEEQLQNGAKPEEISKALNVSLKIVHEVEDDLMAYAQHDESDYDSLD